MLDLELTGKVAIVTGGSAGLGRAAAMKLAREGARVSICARRKEVLERTAGEIRQTGGEVLAIPADVTRVEDVEAVVKATAERFGGVDILLNNAGTSAAAAFMDVDDRTWQTDIELKLMAAIRFCRLSIPIMQKRGGGVIINVTTVGGKAPAARAVPTAVTRAAGINLTKGLANEYASSGIRVNTICLGLVKSEQWERRAKGGDVEAVYREGAALRAALPLLALHEPEADRVHSDARRRVLVREPLGEVDAGRARHRRGHGARRRRLAADGGDVDDDAAAALLHDRDAQAAEPDGGHQLELDVRLPRAVIDVHERGRRRGAGVVEENVDAAEALGGRLHHGLHILGARHVGGNREHLATGLPDLSRRALQHFLAAGADAHARPLARQLYRRGAAESGAAAGHDRHLARQVEIQHGLASVGPSSARKCTRRNRARGRQSL